MEEHRQGTQIHKEGTKTCTRYVFAGEVCVFVFKIKFWHFPWIAVETFWEPLMGWTSGKLPSLSATAHSVAHPTTPIPTPPTPPTPSHTFGFANIWLSNAKCFQSHWKHLCTINYSSKTRLQCCRPEREFSGKENLKYLTKKWIWKLFKIFLQTAMHINELFFLSILNVKNYADSSTISISVYQ